MQEEEEIERRPQNSLEIRVNPGIIIIIVFFCSF